MGFASNFAETFASGAGSLSQRLVRRRAAHWIKKPEEKVTLTFDFTGAIEHVTSATITVRHFGGVFDKNPQTMITTVAAPEGSLVHQRVIGGINGAVYALSCLALDDEGEARMETLKLLVMSREP
jgi:hypothetical protein